MPSNASNAIFPVDLVDLLETRTHSEAKAPFESTLHPSSDLLGSLRHAQLRIAGAPRNPESLVARIRLETGSMWHERMVDWLVKTGLPFMQEVDVKPYLPDGWGGRVDWIFYHPVYKGFVIGDLKTAKGEGMWWINKDGAKQEHLWQLSAYWWALVKMGLPMVRAFGVFYLPMNSTSDGDVFPSVQECEPLPEDVVLGRMNERAVAVKSYELSLEPWQHQETPPADHYLTDMLAPEQPRLQKLAWNKKQEVFDLRLVPHWSAAFCKFPDELCACSTRGVTKIGHFTLDGEYEPRNGFEDEKPTLTPTASDFTRRRKETNADGV